MNKFEQYEQERTVNLLALRAFPRSAGMITGAIVLLILLDPIIALLVCVLVWFITYVIKSIIGPNIVDTNLWSCCSFPVGLIGGWPVRWLSFILMVVIALFKGADMLLTLVIMGGLLIYDIFIVFTRGS